MIHGHGIFVATIIQGTVLLFRKFCYYLSPIIETFVRQKQPMNNFLKSILAILTLPLLYVGFHYASDAGLDEAAIFAPRETESTRSFSWKTLDKQSQPESISLLRQFNNAIVEITERTNPAVVTITTRQT